jgi:hypothetical protein
MSMKLGLVGLVALVILKVYSVTLTRWTAVDLVKSLEEIHWDIGFFLMELWLTVDHLM